MVVKFTCVVLKQCFRRILLRFLDPLVFWRGSALPGGLLLMFLLFFCWIVFPFLYVASEPCRFSFGQQFTVQAVSWKHCMQSLILHLSGDGC